MISKSQSYVKERFNKLLNINSIKIIINFSSKKYTDATLAVRVDEIIDKTKGNTNFPDAEDLLSDVVLMNDEYKLALSKQPSGGIEATVIKQNRRKKLENGIKALASYIEEVSAGNKEVILSSGFEVRKKPSTIGILPKPKHIIIKTGRNKGSIEVVCSPIRGSIFYEFEFTPTPVSETSTWTMRANSKSNLTINNLKSGHEYAFRATGAGASPERTWSEVATSYVL